MNQNSWKTSSFEQNLRHLRHPPRTVANFSMYSSGAPREAKPISCENWAKAGSAKSGACPRSSWQTSGSGVYNGLEEWRMYWVEWNTLKARPARKSRDAKRPATGRRVNPVQSANGGEKSIEYSTLTGKYVKTFTFNLEQIVNVWRPLRRMIRFSCFVNVKFEEQLISLTFQEVRNVS